MTETHYRTEELELAEAMQIRPKLEVPVINAEYKLETRKPDSTRVNRQTKIINEQIPPPTGEPAAATPRTAPLISPRMPRHIEGAGRRV